KRKGIARSKFWAWSSAAGVSGLQRVENFTTESLRPVIEANLSPDASEVVTDGAATYSFIVPKDKHVATNHEQELELTGMIRGTRTMEGAFSLFKRGVIGSYHKL